MKLAESIGSVLTMLLVAAAVLWLAWYTTRLVGRVGAGYVPGGSPGGQRFSVLAQLSLGRNQRLLLLRVGEHCLLLGVTEHEITLLKELEYTEAEQWLQTPNTASEESAFLDILRKNLRKRS